MKKNLGLLIALGAVGFWLWQKYGKAGAPKKAAATLPAYPLTPRPAAGNNVNTPVIQGANNPQQQRQAVQPGSTVAIDVAPLFGKLWDWATSWGSKPTDSAATNSDTVWEDTSYRTYEGFEIKEHYDTEAALKADGTEPDWQGSDYGGFGDHYDSEANA